MENLLFIALELKFPELWRDMTIILSWQWTVATRVK